MRNFMLIFLISFTYNLFGASLSVIDGGEGLLIRIINEKKSIWIDTGSLNKIRQNLNKTKKNNEPLPSDIFLTHLHPDHASGIFELVEKNPEIIIYDNCMPNIDVKDGELIRWTDKFISSHKKRICVNSKSKFYFKDMSIDILWPTGIFESKNHNLYSLVLKVSKNNKSVLIMGDVPKSVEKTIIKNLSFKLRDIDVLVVGHHGSDSASSEDFLKLISPKIAVVSVDKQNVRGYPSKKALERINRNSDQLWITGKDGDFKFYF